MMKKILEILLAIFGIVVLIFFIMIGINSTKKPFELNKHELKKYLELADKNDTKAIVKIILYYDFYIKDHNKSFEFSSKFANLKNEQIQYEILLRITISEGDKIYMQKRMIALKQLVNNKYPDAIRSYKYLLKHKIIDENYNILDLDKLNKTLRNSPYGDKK